MLTRNWSFYLGMTREELVDTLGEPDAKGVTSRKYPTPSVFKYDQVEFHFLPWKNGTCTMVFDNSTHKVLAKELG